jgi:hypothetical protein
MPERFVDIINVHRNDPTNLGDLSATPTRYIDWLYDVPILDIWEPDFNDYRNELHNAAVIYGGGGVLFDGDGTPPPLGSNMRIMHDSQPKALVLWSAGHNSHGGDKIILPEALKSYDLVGLRNNLDLCENAESWYEHVPCVSCLHPEFDRPHDVEHEIVLYKHKDQPLPNDDPTIPVRINSGDDIAGAIQFIASGETVVTNSYHGAYWGILLGRRVIVAEPFSTKFADFQGQVPIVTGKNWRAVLNETQTYPNALQNSRELNLRFAEKAKKLFASIT